MTPAAERPSQAPPAPTVSTRTVPLHLDVRLFASGLNAGLARAPRVEISSTGLLEAPRLRPAWRPHWDKVVTLGVAFPEASLAESQGDVEPSGGWKVMEPAVSDHTSRQLVGPAEDASPRKPTRLPMPHGPLSVADQLFFLLQPPLESLLGGQELVMPFEPFGFQYEGIAWLFSRSAALLADEMGLGKTMQAICAVRLLLRAGQLRSILIVCPKPLITNWQREFSMWAEELPVLAIAGPSPRRRMLWQLDSAPIKIANYELLVRDYEEIGEDDFPAFDLVILDEAQRIKNRESRTAVAARAVTRRRSWALTGTPMENRAEEFAALLEFLGAVPPRGNPNIRRLSRLSAEYVLRRTKDRVLTDLPPRLDRDEYLDLAPAQELAYRTAERDGVIQLNDLGDSITIQHVFELVLRLKQIANFDPLTGHSAKLDRLAAEMEEIAHSGGKAILFSQWTRCLDWLAGQLAEFRPMIYHGGVPYRHRDGILRRFAEDPDSHLLLMSYGVGAVGLNLQFASYVFLFDRWWNPAVEDQAINRAHRIGQQNPVTVTKFICRNTIEERIDRVLRQKRELFLTVIGDSQATNVSLGLDAQEIFGLFDLTMGHGDEARSISPPVAADAQE